MHEDTEQQKLSNKLLNNHPNESTGKKPKMRELSMAEADEYLRAFGEFLTSAKNCKDFIPFEIHAIVDISPAE